MHPISLKRSRSSESLLTESKIINTCITDSKIDFTNLSDPVRLYQILSHDERGKSIRLFRRYNEFFALH